MFPVDSTEQENPQKVSETQTSKLSGPVSSTPIAKKPAVTSFDDSVILPVSEPQVISVTEATVSLRGPDRSSVHSELKQPTKAATSGQKHPVRVQTNRQPQPTQQSVKISSAKSVALPASDVPASSSKSSEQSKVLPPPRKKSSTIMARAAFWDTKILQGENAEDVEFPEMPEENFKG